MRRVVGDGGFGESTGFVRVDDARAFQVGTAGFINRAIRQMMLANQYGTIHPGPGPKRRGLFGTEAMTEIFIDGVDFVWFAIGIGPLKILTQAKHPDWVPGSNKCSGGFLSRDRWVKDRQCDEIPMLQYVYNPVMPLYIAGAPIAGGPGSAQDIDQIFYWLAARTYLYGAMWGLGYAETPMDILSQTFTSLAQDSPSYMIGWNRMNPDPEHVPLFRQDKHGNPYPGRHPLSQVEKNRNYGDPEKERYLRMLAYMRTYVIPEFLVYGEMIRPGIVSPNPVVSFDYNFFYALGARPYPVCYSDIPWGARPHQLEHDSDNYDPFRDRLIRTAGWRRYREGSIIGPHNLVFLLANVGPRGHIFDYKVDLTTWFGHDPVKALWLDMNPGDETTWDQWYDWPNVLEPSGADHRHVIPVDEIKAHHVRIYKIVPDLTQRGPS